MRHEKGEIKIRWLRVVMKFRSISMGPVTPVGLANYKGYMVGYKKQMIKKLKVSTVQGAECLCW
jgi:hypothetical protein